MLLLYQLMGLSVLSVLLPMIVCTAGITITRPIATSRAMDVFPELAGTASSVGSALIFIFAGTVSALVNLVPGSLQVTLGTGFIAMSLFALGLIASICLQQRVKPAA